MQIEPRCYPCQIKRLISEAQLLNLGIEKEIEISKLILDFYANTNETRSAWLGYLARQKLKDYTGDLDPYVEIKQEMNRFSEGQIGSLRKFLRNIKDPVLKFQKACLGAVLGNLMEFFLQEHDFTFKFKTPLIELMNSELFAIEDTRKAYEIARNAKKILLLPDNAGEIFFDRVLIEIIKELNPQVKIVVAIKSGPIINDATINDAAAAKLSEISDVMTTGTNSIGLFFEKTSPEFRKEWYSSDLIIQKGMGHYETSDLLCEPKPCPIFHLFRVKCTTVGNKINAMLNENIAMLIK